MKVTFLNVESECCEQFWNNFKKIHFNYIQYKGSVIFFCLIDVFHISLPGLRQMMTRHYGQLASILTTAHSELRAGINI